MTINDFDGIAFVGAPFFTVVFFFSDAQKKKSEQNYCDKSKRTKYRRFDSENSLPENSGYG